MPAERAFPKSVAVLTEEKSYGRTLLDYDAQGNLVYVGKAERVDASEDEPVWTIKKLFYDVNGNLVEVKEKKGKWSERSSLF